MRDRERETERERGRERERERERDRDRERLESQRERESERDLRVRERQREKVGCRRSLVPRICLHSNKLLHLDAGEATFLEVSFIHELQKLGTSRSTFLH